MRLAFSTLPYPRNMRLLTISLVIAFFKKRATKHIRKVLYFAFYSTQDYNTFSPSKPRYKTRSLINDTRIRLFFANFVGRYER